MKSTMTRERAIEIARDAAAHNRPSYYAEPFEPHPWVVDAVLNGAHLAVHERFDATVLGELTNAWIDFPDSGQVPDGIGEPFQKLLNALGAFLGRDELMKDPDVVRRGELAGAKARISYLEPQVRYCEKWKVLDRETETEVELERVRAELADARAKLAALEASK